MKRLFYLAGPLSLLLLVPLQALAEPLYDLMKKTVEEQIAREELDEELVPYLHALFKEDWALTENDVRDMLKGETQKACDNIIKASNIVSCENLVQRIRGIADDETRIRTLGRSLQAMASSYELPISDLPGRATKLSADLRAILNIWSAGTGSVKSNINTPVIRTFNANPETFGPLIADIGDKLTGLDAEQESAAVWRYQYGVRLIRGERNPRFSAPTIHGDTGTERQYLVKRWDELEQTLMVVWNEIRNHTFDPPLSANETVYYVFPASVLEDAVPENIIIWARVDGNPSENFPYGDVGLQWAVPLEPVLPSLVKDTTATNKEVILGGNYPPEPVTLSSTPSNPIPLDGQGLCTSPANERGYLCRAFSVVAPEERCPVPPGGDPNAIQLVYCTNPADSSPQGVWCCNAASNQCSQTTTSSQCVTEGGSPSADAQGCVANGCNLPPPTEQRFTEAGADVCREIKWRDSGAFDPQTQCKVALRCSANCTPGFQASANAGPKNAEGIIEICVNESSEAANTYLIFHELVHARQKCNMPIGYDPLPGKTMEEQNAVCCKREGEGYRVMCDMMERDGVFSNPDGTPILSPDGVPVNAETCMEAWTNFACGEQQGYRGCYTSRTYSSQFFQKLYETGQRNPADVPVLCSDAADPATMDPRVQQFIELIESSDRICEPGEVSLYKNRIGNNACYIGQCVEMSVEFHRIAAGQVPGSVQDQTAPWDAPETGTPLGNVLMNPPLTQGRLPSYRPELLMREMETALCQLQGLPLRTPPILCAVDALRQLQLTQQTPADTAMGLANQLQEQAASLEDLLDLSQGVGARTGTHMYGEYLRESNRSFAGILSMANELLEELKKIDFPTEMCPANQQLPSPVTSN